MIFPDRRAVKGRPASTITLRLCCAARTVNSCGETEMILKVHSRDNLSLRNIKIRTFRFRHVFSALPGRGEKIRFKVVLFRSVTTAPQGQLPQILNTKNIQDSATDIQQVCALQSGCPPRGEWCPEYEDTFSSVSCHNVRSTSLSTPDRHAVTQSPPNRRQHADVTKGRSERILVL